MADSRGELASDPSIDENDEQTRSAARRLAQEARQALSYGARGIKDVTQAFTAAAKDLQPGRLVKDEYFTLFEAVGALEIMDPKMDSGFVPAGDTFEPTFEVTEGRTSAQMLWIIDELFRLEIAWLEGYPLSQTVFTCLYVDRLLSPDNRAPYTFNYGEYSEPGLSVEEALVHTFMRAYCVGLAKCWQHILGLIQSQNFYEEEDFVTHQFGREFLPKMSCSEAEQLLQDAATWLEGAEMAPDVRKALAIRLQFRRDMLASLDSNPDSWKSCLSSIQSIRDSNVHAEALPDAFSDKVQRQLATSTPPRPALELIWDEACKKWSKLCADMVEANRLTSPPIAQDPYGLQRATWAFAYREPAPNTFARAHMQNLLFGQDLISGSISHMELFLRDIKDLVLAGHPLADSESFQVELPSDPRHAGSRIMESFMDKAFDEYLNLYRMVCQNRCRIRRTFTQAIPILDELESEATRMDEELNSIIPLPNVESHSGLRSRLDPLSKWTKFHKLRIVIWTIQLGFETDIYQPHEICRMYWLLLWYNNLQGDLLLGIEPFIIDRMKSLTENRQTQQVAECLVSQDWLKGLSAVNETTHLIAGALWRLYTMLLDIHAIKAPRRKYAQEELLWDTRMKSFFGLVNDPVPSLEDFEYTQRFDSVELSCQTIDGAIKAARSHLAEMKKMGPVQLKCVGTEEQWKREAKQLETTCVAIAVQTSQVLRICSKRGQGSAGMGEDLSELMEVTIPIPGVRYHDWWIVPQVKEKK